MQLSLRSFTSLVEAMSAAVQSRSRQLLDLSIGSVLRAVIESNASVALWMQWLILQVLQTTRASTSNGTDLDSWMADFSLLRLPAVEAAGTVTLSRFTAIGSALVPIGALVKTGDGKQTFAVVPDTLNPAFSVFQNGYVLGPSVSSVDVPVEAQTAGIAGNVQAGSVSLLGSAIPGVDTVSNAAPFLNGIDAETDDAFRSRFANYFATRSRATVLAVGYAITGIQQGLQYVVQENVDSSGASRPGSFLVTVDDGSGTPSTSLLTTISTAIDGVRPIGTSFFVQPPLMTTVSVALTITTSSALKKPAIAKTVQDAVVDYIDSLQIGIPLPITRLAQVAYAASADVVNVSQVQINGMPADITPSPSGVLKAGAVTVS